MNDLDGAVLGNLLFALYLLIGLGLSFRMKRRIEKIMESKDKNISHEKRDLAYQMEEMHEMAGRYFWVLIFGFYMIFWLPLHSYHWFSRGNRENR